MGVTTVQCLGGRNSISVNANILCLLALAASVGYVVNRTQPTERAATNLRRPRNP